MYQLLICSVLYSIVAEKKIWIALEKFLLLFCRVLMRTLGKNSQDNALGIHKTLHSAKSGLPSVPNLALGKI